MNRLGHLALYGVASLKAPLRSIIIFYQACGSFNYDYLNQNYEGIPAIKLLSSWTLIIMAVHVEMGSAKELTASSLYFEF
jgi:hypothetical protein